MMRRPRRPATKTSDFGFGSCNKIQESVAFDYEKSGVAILGQHFGDEVLDVPIKKRILMLQSPSLSNERAPRSAQPHLPELPVGSKQNGSKPEKDIPDLNDFSGIELLAAAACHTSVYEEHTTPRVELESYVKDDIALIDSEDSSVPSKDVRLHWDLNTVMDEWEEPCCDILVDPHSEKGYSKDELQKAEKNLNYETTNSQVTGSCDQEQVKSVSEVVQGGCNNDDKVTSEDRLSDCCGSNTTDKVKPGYDSPVEDGELRDTWQKNEVEEMECVDYESDNIYEDNFDTIESVNNEVITSEVPVNEIEQHDKTKLPEHSQSVVSEEKVIKNDSCIHRSRSENLQDSYSRGKREFGQEKSTGRDGSSYHGWDSRNTQRYQSRSKHVIGSSRNSQPINYNPRGSYKSFNIRQERNESYSIHRGNSRERFKSGLGFHLSRREDYNNHDTCHSERKVSSFSSNFNRGAHLSRRRSRSRSRSESPIAWHFQKKSKVDTKRESPDKDKYNMNGESREKYNNNLGRLNLKSSDDFCPKRFNGSSRFEGNDDKYGMMNGGRFRYYNKDNGFRYARNENRYFKDPVVRDA
ncbi:hypothetical protein L1887_23326 [Cichorium endivia]|nr:hypothetical protein L1887_23326 [Cichorium endivia]